MTKRLVPYDELKAARKVRREVKLRQPMKAVNKERVAKKAESEGYDPDYLDWIRKQPCIVCGERTGAGYITAGGRIGYAKVEAAHMVAGRTQGTDMTALPVEAFYHREQHRIGIKSWAKHHNLDIPALIAKHRKYYALEMAEKAKHG